MRAIMANENMETTYLIDNFVQTQKGEPYRLLPFGTVVKNGVRREITPEYAARFQLPHFKPPIKLGSHEETTPAGGQITALEVRADGLYAVPEFTDKGAQALADGDFRYHSPEVIWENGALEDPDSGALIQGPLIIGDALLHTPHLGEKAALYTIQPKEQIMAEETVSVPKSFWDTFVAPIFAKKAEPAPEPKPEPVKVVETDEFKAVAKERDDFKAKVDAIEAEKVRTALVAGIVKDLQDKEKFGMSYVELSKAEEAASMMAGMTEEQRAWCMRNFSALAVQVKTSNLLGEKGSEGSQAGEDPKAAFNVAVLAISKDKAIGYNAAFEQAKISHPDLFAAAFSKK